MNTEEIFWGRYGDKKYPDERFDPLQSFVNEDGVNTGYRINVIPTRGSRPRDYIKPKSDIGIEDKSTIKNDSEIKSIFLDVSKGNGESIPIATNESVIGKLTDFPKKHYLLDFKAITIINKYSPLNSTGMKASGIALVAYSNEYMERFTSEEAIKSILISLKFSIQSILDQKIEKYKSSIIFFNVGRRAGASIRHLHAQSYVIPNNQGLITHYTHLAPMKFEQKYKSCLVCTMSKGLDFTDHLNQIINISKRIIWEDENVIVLVPNAPIRVLSLRIIPKKHLSWIGETSNRDLASVAKALIFCDKLIELATPSKWPSNVDRIVAFRQSKHIDTNFHLFIDVLPAIPFGGSELVDSLSIATLDPDITAEIMKERINLI